MNNEIKIQPSKGNNKVEISNNFAQYFEQLAKKHADDAKESELLAKDWANKLGSTVDDTEYSAKHYALKSKEEHDGAITDIATAKTELEQSIATGLEDYNTNAQAKFDSLQTQFDTSISDIKKQETTSINAVKTTQTTAESSITELKTSAELTITNGMADITSNKEQSMSAINENRETSLAEIESAKSGAVSSINTTKDNAVSTVKQTGTDEYNKILSTGIDSKLGENLITNCLLEVPQRIKYTLVDGVLTILKGSVCIVPYGTEDKTADLPKGATFINENFKVFDTQYTEDADGKGKFFVWAELVNDLSASSWGNGSILVNIFISDDKGKASLNPMLSNYQYSGNSAPTSFQADLYAIWYDTSENKVKYTKNKGVTWDGFVCSLNIIDLLIKDGNYQINRVLNGMGVIGSTIWTDKGVKGLVSIDRNEADGTLINKEVVIDKLNIITLGNYTAPAATLAYLSEKLWGNQLDYVPSDIIYEQNTKPSIASNYRWYDTINGKWYINDTGATVSKYSPWLKLADMSYVNGKITSFAPKLPFRAADENDIDGRWMRQSLHIINGETAFPLGSQQYRDYDISNYLPNDGHIYEVAIEILAFSGSATNATAHWWISNVIDSFQSCSCGGRAYSGTRDQQYANGIQVVPSRILRLYCSSTQAAPVISVLRLCGYRKVR